MSDKNEDWSSSKTTIVNVILIALAIGFLALVSECVNRGPASTGTTAEEDYWDAKDWNRPGGM